MKQQDRSGGSYNNVIYFIIAINAWQVCLGPIYDFLDGRSLGHALRKPEQKRLGMVQGSRTECQDASAPDHPQSSETHEGPARSSTYYKGWQPNKTACLVVGTELTCAIVVAWVVCTLL